MSEKKRRKYYHNIETEALVDVNGNEK